MPRRYLTLEEAESSLNRGKSIECFLGACDRNGKPGVRWLSASRRRKEIHLSIFESADIGSDEFLDLYAFGPLDPELEKDEPDEKLVFENFGKFLSEIEARFPTSTSRLVNDGIIQDEYADFIAKGRK